jgi:hypothetical protein
MASNRSKRYCNLSIDDQRRRDHRIHTAVLACILATMKSPTAAVVIVAALTACSPANDAPSGVSTRSPRAVPSASESAAASREGPTPTASPTATRSASATDPGLAAGSLAAIVTSDLVVRSAPGTGADSEMQPVTLSAPSVVYVVDGPVVADGYAWYLVDPVRPIWALGYPTAGWVAAGGTDGEAWIGPHEGKCEAEPTTIEDLVDLAPQMGLYCYAERMLTVDAVADNCGIIAGSNGPWSSACQLFIPGRDPSAIPPGCFDVCAPWVAARFNNLSPPASGALVSVTGHFDDPNAQHCDGGPPGEASPLAVHACRLAFVATSLGAP